MESESIVQEKVETGGVWYIFEDPVILKLRLKYILQQCALFVG
jgi:hypothetical protein